MRYQMRQKMFSLGADFTIKDADDREVYVVDGKVFTIRDQLAFRDPAGKELAFIRQKLLAWGPTYEIFKQDQLCAVVKKELFTLFRCRFTVDVPGPDDLEAKGNLLDHEYQFTLGGAAVAKVSKQWFSWTDSYGVDIASGQDDVLILASSVVIDMVCHQGGSESPAD